MHNCATRCILSATLFACHISVACSQDVKARTKLGGASELRLPYTAETSVYPPSLNGHAITVYKDPSDNRQRYYIKPVFLPDWKSFESEVAKLCEAKEPTHIVAAPLSAEFAPKRLFEEVKRETSKENTENGNKTPFAYPIFSLYVVSGARDPSDSVSTKVQFRYPPGVSETLPQGALAAIDTPLDDIGRDPPIEISETCGNLMQIVRKRDLTAYAYSEGAEIKLNSSAAFITSFVKSRAFGSIDRSEKQTGVITIKTSSDSKAVGFNLGGFVAGRQAADATRQEQIDTRMRYMSANLVQYAAEESILSGALYSRLEALEHYNAEAIIKLLTDFILQSAERVSAKIEAKKDEQWKMVVGTYERSLSREETEYILDSAPTHELEMSGKEEMDCSLMASGGGKTAGGAKEGGEGGGTKCSAERSSKGKYSNAIHWKKSGKDWVPTAIDLYAVAVQEIKSNAQLGYEQAIVREMSDAQVHILKQVNNYQPSDAIVDYVNKRIEEVIAKIEGPKKVVVPIAGGRYKTISYWGHNGDAHQDWQCLPPAPATPPDFEKIGAEDTQVCNGRAGVHQITCSYGCQGSGHCDSTGEWCVSYYRSAGCLVNKIWLAWYNARKTSLGQPIDKSEICKPPL